MRYFVVGGSGTILDLATLKLFRAVFGLSPTLSVAINQVIIICYNFLLHKHFSFKNKAMPHKQFVRYMVLVGLNYFIAVQVMYFFGDKLGYDPMLVRICNIAASVSWNFVLFKKWVYDDPVHKSLHEGEKS